MESNKHTEEFYDIAQALPLQWSTWIVYGITIFVSMIIALGFCIEVPERIYADAKIISSKPPITLNAQTSGKLHIINNFKVHECHPGEYLAVIENSADYNDVLALKSWYEKNKNWKEESVMNELLCSSYMLGEMEADYYNLKMALIKYFQLNKGQNELAHSLNIIEKQIESNQKLFKNQELLLNSYQNEQEIRYFYLRSDSILYTKDIITKDKYDKSNIEHIEIQNKILSIEQQMEQTSGSTVQNLIKHKQILDAITNAKIESETALENAYFKLLTQIKNWEKNYVFIAPDECKAEFADFISDGTFVTVGQPIYNIVYKNNAFLGIAMLPSDGAGNVVKGDSVNLKMLLYPYQEYGVLKGCIENISMNSIDKGYLLYITLPNGLRSNNNHVFAFAETMYGQAEIITIKRKLIYLLFNHLKAATSLKKQSENTSDETSPHNK